MKKNIRARNAQAMSNIEPKLWSQISDPGSGLLVRVFRLGFQV